MGQGGAGWVKNFSVGNFDGAPSTALSSVLLILLNKLRESDKMRGSLSIFIILCDKFNKFNNTSAQMLDSMYLMKLRLF